MCIDIYVNDIPEWYLLLLLYITRASCCCLGVYICLFLLLLLLLRHAPAAAIHQEPIPHDSCSNKRPVYRCTNTFQSQCYPLLPYLRNVTRAPYHMTLAVTQDLYIDVYTHSYRNVTHCCHIYSTSQELHTSRLFQQKEHWVYLCVRRYEYQ